MRRIFLHIFLVSMVFCVSTVSRAQTVEWTGTPQNYEKFNERLLNHYTENELLEIKNSSPGKFSLISYYYLATYTLEITDSSNIYQPLFYPEKFDISNYENQRKLDEAVVIEFDKYGLKLTIFPYNQLEMLTPLQEFLKNELEN